ncbi:MAG: hypothetical protein RLZZ436_1440 [Planctomycetota bacterium]|jgi:hypothetical protein
MSVPLRTLAIFVLVLLLTGWWRLSASVHHLDVFVRLAEADPAREVAVHARLLNGELHRLNQLQVDRRLWLYAARGGVDSLVITGTAPDVLPECEVRLGMSWLDAVPVAIRDLHRLSPQVDDNAEILQRLQLDSAVEVRTARHHWSSGWLAADALNWGGDGWFAAVVFAQAAWLCWFGWGLWWMADRFAARGEAAKAAVGESAGSRQGLMGLLLQLPRVIFVGLLGHQIFCCLDYLMSISVPGEQLAGLAFFGIVWLLYMAWVRWVDNAATSRGLILRMIFAGTVLLILKAAWLQTVDYRASSDYAKYEKLGWYLAAGDWESVDGMARDLVAPVYLVRAWAWMFPVSLFFGPDRTALELANCALQGLSVVLMCVLISRVVDLKTAARFLPLAFVVPEFWYSAGMVTHNVPGYFWIPAAWLAFDIFDRSCRRTSGTGGRRLVAGLLCALLCGTVLGVSLAFVNFTKGYGSIFLLSLLLVLVCRSLLSARDGAQESGIPRIPERLLFFVTTVVALRLLSHDVTGYLHEHSKLRLVSHYSLAAISGLDVRSADVSQSSATWLSQYFIPCPPQHSWQLLARKFIHEYICGGWRVYVSAAQKNGRMGLPLDAMAHVSDRLAQGEMLHSCRYMPLAVFQVTVACLIQLCLLAAGFMRLLVIRSCAFMTGEVYPLLTVLLTLTAACLFTDGAPYSGQNYGYPLCWTAALLAPGSLLNRLPTTVRRLSNWLPILQPGRFAAGVALCAVVALLHTLLGNAVDRCGLTFHRLTLAESSASQPAEDAGVSRASVGDAYAGRLHARVQLNPADLQLRAGDFVTETFNVTADVGKLHGLRFFISGNPRYYQSDSYSRRTKRLQESWQGLPIEGSVVVGNLELWRGPLEQLVVARFAELSAENWLKPGQNAAALTNSVPITLKLECRADVDLRNVPWVPSLAVEFFH